MQKQRKVKTQETTKYTISLPSELHQEVRELAFRHDCSMALIFQEAIAKYINNNKEMEVFDE